MQELAQVRFEKIHIPILCEELREMRVSMHSHLRNMRKLKIKRFLRKATSQKQQSVFS